MGQRAVLVVLIGLLSVTAAATEVTSDEADRIAVGVYQKHMAAQQANILDYLKGELARERAIYAARLLPALKGDAMVTFASKQGSDAVAVLVGGEFEDSEKQPAFEFQGLLKTRKIRPAPQGGLAVEFVPLVPGEFYLVKVTSANFTTRTPGYNRALQALACAVVKEGSVSGHHCELVKPAI